MSELRRRVCMNKKREEGRRHEGEKTQETAAELARFCVAACVCSSSVYSSCTAYTLPCDDPLVATDPCCLSGVSLTDPWFFLLGFSWRMSTALTPEGRP